MFGEMSIILDDVSCLLHLPIRGKLLDHERIIKDDSLDMMVNSLRVDPETTMRKFEKTSEAHAKFEFLKKGIYG